MSSVAQAAAAALPDDVLRAHVWPRAHELALRPVLRAIQQCGLSCIENLPPLLVLDGVVRKLHDDVERPGWSTRVAEARRARRRQHMQQ